MTKKRIEWIDIAKGFAIILVIVGHSVGAGMTRGIIFSFHMPLFFILSCAAYRFSADGSEFLNKGGKSFRHLFLPAAGIYAFSVIISLIKDFSDLRGYSLLELRSYFAGIINAFVYGSGTDIMVGDSVISRVGMAWFLFVLFFGRTLFDYLHLRLKQKQLYIAVALCSVAGVFIGMVQELPFSFDIALAIQPLFLFGLRLKDYAIESKAVRTVLISFAAWIGTFFIIYHFTGSYLELACRKYALYPLCFVCAVFGTMFVAGISQLVSKAGAVSRPLKYLGKNSLILLIIHCFDIYYRYIWELTGNRYINTALRVAEDIIIFVIVMLIITACKKFRTEKN